MSSKFRPYQKEIDESIFNELTTENKNKCIVKAFCGTGKSNIMAYGKAFQQHKVKVYVFPSLSLIDQFNTDYLTECKNMLPICSESTTDKDHISTFMKKKSNKTICITYNSFHLLNEYKINMCIFDEAHHAIGETYQELIFNNPNIEKSCFFTATPKTANGIDMLKDCGKIVYDYPYLRGVAEGYLNPFEIRVDLFGDNTINNIYDSIARAYYKTGNNRILTFHSDVNTESPTSVRNFVNKKEITKSFKRVVKEFPTMTVPSIQMLGFYSELKLKERRDILKEFDESKYVYILSSCETMGEGIDTKNANMCVFADAKTSFVKIIQNIGRVVRKQFGVDKPHSTILLPIYIDKTKYEECKTAEECDAAIREEMKKGQDFTPILNVMSALKQEDEDLYDICLYYPNNYSPKELEHNFKAKGYTIGEEQELEEIFDDDLEEVAERDNIQIDIHTDSLEEPIISYGESERVVSILQTEDKYCKIEGEEKAIKPPKRIRLDVHTNMDIQVLWKIEHIDLGSCLLDCEVNDNWEERLEELKEFIDREKRRPNKKTEKSLNCWLIHQTQYYKNNKMNDIREKLFEEFIEKYKEYFKTDNEIWFGNFEELKKFIYKEKRRPNKEKNKEKSLGNWLSDQISNYKTLSGIFKDNPEKYEQWKEFIEKNKKYFKTLHEIWNENLTQLQTFLDKEKRIPSQHTKTEKTLGAWLSMQIQNYKKKINGFKNSKNCKQWEYFIEKNKEYFKSNDDKWN
jgi:superfamily II DNA or RNA helicase